jgi:hypothetical protein
VNTNITSMTGITGGIATADYLQLDTGATVTPTVARFQWDSTEGGPQIGMAGGNVNLQIGQETVVLVYNNTGSALSEGQVVYVTGSQGQRLTVGLAQANNDATSAAIIGVVTEPIANNASGFITTQGTIHNINTTGFVDGAVIYLSPTTPGAWTTTKPVAPYHLVMVGYIVKGGSTGAGSIYVHVQNGYELDELHNVLITSPVTGQTLVYNSSTGLWVNNTVSLTSGVNGTLPIANGGTGQTTQAAALTALAGTQVSGSYLRSDGTNTSLSAIQAADVPTLNQNTTGTAGNVTGVVAIVNGGTGATTISGAQTNLQVDPAGTAVAMAIALG